MPTKVANVDWRCTQCSKRLWLKPSAARTKKFCSRACQYEAQKVEVPARAKQSAKKTFGERTCELCSSSYEARTKQQRFCSQTCATNRMHEKRRGQSLEPRPCEHCSSVFVPRQGSAGRFCSWECKNKGQRGDKASGWKGGRHVTEHGYIAVLLDGKYVLEHRFVMEKHLGRSLERHETVHHINGKRDDNRIENLQLRSGKHGKGAAHRCADCGSRNVVAVPL